MKTLAEELLEYYKQNGDDFNHDIEQLDWYNGCLGDRRLTPMDELDEIYSSTDALEILRRAYFGHDDDSWTIENGERVYDEFNPNRDYFYYNGYGNLVSTDELDYSDYLDIDYVSDIIDYEAQLDLSDGAQEIIDEYEAEGEDDEH